MRYLRFTWWEACIKNSKIRVKKVVEYYVDIVIYEDFILVFMTQKICKFTNCVAIDFPGDIDFPDTEYALERLISFTFIQIHFCDPVSVQLMVMKHVTI